MTIGTLVITIAVVALLLTLAIGFTTRRINNWLVSFLQNFCGALFIFSGWVKAVDPLGTAFKMEQYFAEFESTFSGSWFSFLAPMFPWLAEYSIAFSVFMIVLEIVLGIMGGDENAVTLITSAGAENWPRMSKTAVAERLAQRIAEALA